MASLASPGLGSGLDINGLITKLMAVEQQPLTTFARSEASFQAKLSAYGTMKSSLSTFQTSVKTLTSASTFNTQLAATADATIATASATKSAALGNYSLEVKTLAQSQKLKTATTFATPTTTLGAVGDTLTFDFGTYAGGGFTNNPAKGTKTVTLASGQNTLSGVATAINAANIGASATLINDGSGFRLLLTSTSGASNALRIATTGGLDALAYDASTGGTTSMTQSLAAQDATFTIDGIAISKSSNTVTDALDGVTLNLLKTNVGSGITLSVARDTSAAKTAIGSFVTAFNTANTSLRSLTAYDSATKKGAVLQGDSTALTVLSKLRATMNTALSYAGGGVSSLSDVGISFKADGTVALDYTKLETALSDTSKDISTLFAASGKATDSLISFTGSTTNTKPGIYDVTISQIATQGLLTGDASQGVTTTITSGNGKSVGSATAGLTISAANDTFKAVIDGVTSSTITLTQGTYTASTLASHLQTQINADTGITDVTVKQSNGVLTITSNSTGATSTVSLIDDADAGAAANLLGATPTSTAGTTPNNTLNLTVDGAAAALTLPDGSYSNAGLLAMLQAAINGNSTLAASGAAVSAAMGGTQGKNVGSTTAGLTITAGVNDTFAVTVDGTTSATVTLSAGTYTAGTLASEVQAKINADATLKAASASVAVTESNGVISVTSNRYGSSSAVSFSATAGTTSLLGTAVVTAGTTVAGNQKVSLTSNGFGSSSAVAITGGSAATTLFGTITAGTAGVDVAGTLGAQTNPATNGTSVGSIAAGLTIDATNDTFKVTVDGVVSGTITLTQASPYASTAALIAELQTKINADATLTAASKSVTVTESSGIITVKSNSAGSSSSVVFAEVGADVGVANLFGVATATTGTNGTTGYGKQLSATAGNTSGLAITVNGGAFSAGGTARGTFSYEQGFAYRLDLAITDLLSTSGSIKSRTDGITSSIATLGSKREALNRRLVQIEARYRKQFNALDSVVASMQQTSSYLSQQLSALSSSTR